jgi:hypothetical protein
VGSDIAAVIYRPAGLVVYQGAGVEKVGGWMDEGGCWGPQTDDTQIWTAFLLDCADDCTHARIRCQTYIYTHSNTNNKRKRGNHDKTHQAAENAALPFTPSCVAVWGEEEVAVGGEDHKVYVYSLLDPAQPRAVLEGPRGQVRACGDAVCAIFLPRCCAGFSNNPNQTILRHGPPTHTDTPPHTHTDLGTGLQPRRGVPGGGRQQPRGLRVFAGGERGDGVGGQGAGAVGPPHLPHHGPRLEPQRAGELGREYAREG